MPDTVALEHPSHPSRVRKTHVAFIVVEAAFIWLLEAIVGTVPLIAHYFIHVIAAITTFPAVCDAGTKNCRIVTDDPYSEIRILAVVIAGISVIGAFGYGHHFRRSALTGLTYSLIFVSGAACVVGAIMYAVTTVGLLSANATRTTWWVLAAALGSSLFLSIDKAAREPLSQ